MAKQTQTWEAHTSYQIFGRFNREAILHTVPQEDVLGEDGEEMVLGATLLMNFLKQEIDPRMLTILTGLLGENSPYTSSAILSLKQKISEMKETVELARETIVRLNPPKRVIDYVRKEVSMQDPSDLAFLEMKVWLDYVEAFNYNEGGYADPDEGVEYNEEGETVER